MQVASLDGRVSGLEKDVFGCCPAADGFGIAENVAQHAKHVHAIQQIAGQQPSADIPSALNGSAIKLAEVDSLRQMQHHASTEDLITQLQNRYKEAFTFLQKSKFNMALAAGR